MKYRYLPATIMLLSGAITSITCIVNRYEALYSLKLLLAVLLIFWFIGSMARFFLLRIIAMSIDSQTEQKDKDKTSKEVSEEGSNKAEASDESSS